MDFSPQSGHEQAGTRLGVIVSNEQFFKITNLAIVCPITNTIKGFPLHVKSDYRTKTLGEIQTEHVKCLDIISRNVRFKEKLPSDLLEEVLERIDAFF